MRSLAALFLITALTGPAYAGADPARTIQKADDGWIAFEFPALEGTRSPCCWTGGQAVSPVPDTDDKHMLDWLAQVGDVASVTALTEMLTR